MAKQRLINLLPLLPAVNLNFVPLQRLLLRDGEYNADTVNNFDLIRRRSRGRRAEKRDRPEMRNKMGIPQKEPSAKVIRGVMILV